MTVAAHPFRFREHAFVWALLLSIGLHAALMATEGFDLSDTRPVDSLIIQLQPMEEPPPPPPPAEPEPPKPQPPKAPKAKPQPAPAPAPAPTIPQPVAQQPAPPPPQAAAEPPAPVAPPPEVIAAPAPPEATPTFTVPQPPPEPPKVQAPSQQDLDAARSGYSALLAREFAKHRLYPRIAQMRGWQGTVRVQLELDAQGNVTQSAIKESSGFEVLDKQALEMVRKATPLPLPPETLRNRAFSILVPVTFKLG